MKGQDGTCLVAICKIFISFDSYFLSKKVLVYEQHGILILVGGIQLYQCTYTFKGSEGQRIVGGSQKLSLFLDGTSKFDSHVISQFHFDGFPK